MVRLAIRVARAVSAVLPVPAHLGTAGRFFKDRGVSAGFRPRGGRGQNPQFARAELNMREVTSTIGMTRS